MMWEVVTRETDMENLLSGVSPKRGLGGFYSGRFDGCESTGLRIDGVIFHRQLGSKLCFAYECVFGGRRQTHTIVCVDHKGIRTHHFFPSIRKALQVKTQLCFEFLFGECF